MGDSTVIEEAAALTRLTLPMMVQHEIPTTPKRRSSNGRIRHSTMQRRTEKTG